MAKLKDAYLARAVPNSENNYDRGLFFLANTMHDMLVCFYCKNELARILPHPTQLEISIGDAILQKAVSVFEAQIITTFRKLTDNGKDTYNFKALLTHSKNRLENSVFEELSIQVEGIVSSTAAYKDFTNVSGVHLNRGKPPERVHAFISVDINLYHAMLLLDQFVIGEIPYFFAVGDEDDENNINLREYMVEVVNAKGEMPSSE